jgi:hypothetical protein
MHSTSGAWNEYSFQPRWRCCCERIWLARESGQAKTSCNAALPAILRPISRMMRPSRERRIRNFAMAVEVLGVRVAACHHGCVLGDAQIRLPQPHPMLFG